MPPPPDPRAAPPTALGMRRAMSAWTTGVAIVISEDGAGRHGMTINSLTSISLDPPILLISLTHGTRTTAAVESSGVFTVSVLGARQEPAARHFARNAEDKFASFVSSDPGRVDGAVATFECRVIRRHDIGDHRVFYGEVVSLDHVPGQGLAFANGGFGAFQGSGGPPVPWLS